MKLIIYISCLVVMIILMSGVVQAAPDWQSSKEFKSIHSADSVEAALIYLDWYHGKKEQIVSAYLLDGQEIFIIALVDIQGAYLAVEPTRPLFAFAATAEGAVRALFEEDAEIQICFYSVEDMRIRMKTGPSIELSN